MARSGEQPQPCTAHGPPNPPGFFSIQAGLSDPYSPVIGSLTRVEPPGPGRRPPGTDPSCPDRTPLLQGYGPGWGNCRRLR